MLRLEDNQFVQFAELRLQLVFQLVMLILLVLLVLPAIQAAIPVGDHSKRSVSLVSIGKILLILIVVEHAHLFVGME